MAPVLWLSTPQQSEAPVLVSFNDHWTALTLALSQLALAATPWSHESLLRIVYIRIDLLNRSCLSTSGRIYMHHL